MPMTCGRSNKRHNDQALVTEATDAIQFMGQDGKLGFRVRHGAYITKSR